ncbi:hypothetical protein RN001_004861 [Aquatica leii]|uniref:Uncharacterized protein n=1 Tax=Aquatica leii TaxID=1421715 RepID=A0AAN7Q0G1_9COLE|nr:hypothetical protein RN001_004861 [Aquatica leii]
MSKKFLGSRGKELIASLIKYFELERYKGGPLILVNAVRERVAAALNISISTVSSVSTAVANNEVLRSPKKRKRSKPVTNVETVNENVIHNVIYRMCENRRDGKSTENCKNMWKESLTTLTPKVWADSIEHTQKIIKKYYVQAYEHLLCKKYKMKEILCNSDMVLQTKKNNVYDDNRIKIVHSRELLCEGNGGTKIKFTSKDFIVSQLDFYYKYKYHKLHDFYRSNTTNNCIYKLTLRKEKMLVTRKSKFRTLYKQLEF